MPRCPDNPMSRWYDSVAMPPQLIHARNPGPLTGAGNNTWLIDGARPVLVDAGVGASAHVDAVAAALGGRDLAALLITHGHPDHASGAPALRARWPRLDVCGARPQADGAWGLADGDRIAAGDGVLAVVATPGHASDHLCFWDASSSDLFAGDMLVAGGTVMIPPKSGGGSLRDYLSSLERLAALKPARVLPGHGPVIDQPLALIAAYIAHRHEREAQVRACLEAGVTDPAAIVLRVYPDLSPALRGAARLTVEAHLEKIADDARG
jgi:glyoxylase-like metal-dependent hydrolase (beta-lactamase superfamily II)